MPVFKPFSAIRPDRKYAAEVLCPPYDVVTREEASAISAASPNSFMHIIRTDGDLMDEPLYSDKIYKHSSELLSDFLKRGILKEDNTASFFIYSQTVNDYTQTGIVGCASIDDYENGLIKRHEITREDKERDRIKHFDTCNAHTEPVFLIYKNSFELKEITERIMSASEPEYDTVDPYGVHHRLWTVSDTDDITLYQQYFKEMPALYIADGHHRTASAVKVGHDRRRAFPDFTGDEEFNYFMAVAFPDDQLHVLDYNRLIKDLNGYSYDEFLDKLSEIFEITDNCSDDPHPSCKHTCTMYMNRHWYTLKFKAGITDDSDPVKSLDVSVLQERVLAPLLGITEPRTDQRISFAGGIKGSDELERRVDSGEMAVAFEMYPVSVQEIMDIADAGMIMPPKSTWFEPKISSGWFIHKF
jgi:uncharacterized protein (DUF1015 family)